MYKDISYKKKYQTPGKIFNFKIFDTKFIFLISCDLIHLKKNKNSHWKDKCLMLNNHCFLKKNNGYKS